MSGIGIALFLYILGYRTPETNAWQHIQGTLPDWITPRIDGWFKSPNLMCNYLIFCLGAALVPVATRALRRLRGAIIAASIWTFSSGLGALTLILETRWPSRVIRCFLCAVAAGILIVNVFSYPALRNGHMEPSHRAQAWTQAYAHFREHPIMGSGPNQAHILVHFNYPTGEPTSIADAHSLPLSLLSQVGLVGATIFFGLIWSVSQNAIKTADRPLAVALLTSVVFHGLTGSFEDARHLWIVMGYLASSTATPQFIDAAGHTALTDLRGSA